MAFRTVRYREAWDDRLTEVVEGGKIGVLPFCKSWLGCSYCVEDAGALLRAWRRTMRRKCDVLETQEVLRQMLAT